MALPVLYDLYPKSACRYLACFCSIFGYFTAQPTHVKDFSSALSTLLAVTVGGALANVITTIGTRVSGVKLPKWESVKKKFHLPYL